MATRIRRVRVADTPVEKRLGSKDRAGLDGLLQSLAKSIHKRDAALREIKAQEAELMQAMESLGLLRYASPEAEAVIETPAGRSMSYIEPEDLWDALDAQETFMQCVKVQVTKASKYLSGKELSKIMQTIPPKPGEPVVKVTVFP